MAKEKDPRCQGCGHSFKGERGLRAHQSQRFVSLACKPVKQETKWCERCHQYETPAQTVERHYR